MRNVAQTVLVHRNAVKVLFSCGHEVKLFFLALVPVSFEMLRSEVIHVVSYPVRNVGRRRHGLALQNGAVLRALAREHHVL